MSIALIEETAKEVRRLAIAGSSLAPGDFRLKKLIAPLEQAGAKAPVFTQIAKSISDLVNATEADSATRLLSLSTLLNAILYTQGQSGASGEMKELDSWSTKSTSTRSGARALKPLIEALSTAGSSRFSLIKDAFERNAFNDLRLVIPAIKALGDNYPEIADLVAEKVLPQYGPGIVPYLKAGLDLNGKRADTRRLSVVHELDPVESLALCKSALEEGSADVKAAAIRCLGKHEDCLPVVMEQTKARNKVLRAAALEALAEHDRPEITKLFVEQIQGKSLAELVRPFRSLKNPQVLGAMLAEGNRVFELIATKDSALLARGWEIFDCLESQQGPEVEKFLLTLLGNTDKFAKVKAEPGSQYAGIDLVVRLVTFLYEIGSPPSLAAILEKRSTLPEESFPHVFRSALRTWTPDKVFTAFSPLLSAKKKQGNDASDNISAAMWVTGQAKGATTYLWGTPTMDSGDYQILKDVKWDKRWIEAAIQSERTLIVCSLAEPDSRSAFDYLLKQLSRDKEELLSEIIDTLARCNYAQVSDTFMETLKRRVSNKKTPGYTVEILLHSARNLPLRDLAKLEAFATNLPENFADRYLMALNPLRERASESQQT